MKGVLTASYSLPSFTPLDSMMVMLLNSGERAAPGYFQSVESIYMYVCLHHVHDKYHTKLKGGIKHYMMKSDSKSGKACSCAQHQFVAQPTPHLPN